MVQVKLLAERAQLDSLVRTVQRCNQVACQVSVSAHEQRAAHRHLSAFSMQKSTYAQAKQSGLSAQPALLVISKVAGAYATLRANLRAGRYGPQGSARRARVEGTPIRFRRLAGQPFDDRCLSWRIDPESPTGTVSIWTVDGRMRGIVFVGEPGQVEQLRRHRCGQTDLVIRPDRHGRFTAYLIATVNVPVAPVVDGPHLDTASGWIGVDMGVENIAVPSDRALATELISRFGDGHVKDRRTRNRELREKLQRKGTKSTKRLLKKLARKEARFAADVNHQIAKRIIAEAERTGRGIAVEELTGIRERVRLRKPQRATHSSWAFAQLGAFLEYRAHRAGAPFVQVDPAYTSQRCTMCGHTEPGNRPTQARFVCRDCGYAEHADIVASDNIAARAPHTYRALSTVPGAA